MINHRHDRGRIGYSDPYPVHLLKRVDRPTTVIHDDQVQRVDERESGFNRAGRGDFGPHLKKEFFRFVDKHPLSGALIQMGFNLRKCVDGAIAPNMAPLPDDPEWMAGHIKETAYFLRADLVGICELPMAVDKPIDFGLQDFCDKCGKCARECPSGAISPGEKIIHNGYEKWPNNVQQCARMRVGNKNGSGCGTCIKVCPWSKPATTWHRLANWTMRHIPFARRFGVLGDDLFGYGKSDPEKKWWLDLEDVDGHLRIPPDAGGKIEMVD